MPSVVEIDLGSMDRLEPERTGGDGELHRARDGIVIGERERSVSKLQRACNELIGERDAV
jgi:ribosomal protein S3